MIGDRKRGRIIDRDNQCRNVVVALNDPQWRRLIFENNKTDSCTFTQYYYVDQFISHSLVNYFYFFFFNNEINFMSYYTLRILCNTRFEVHIGVLIIINIHWY